MRIADLFAGHFAGHVLLLSLAAAAGQAFIMLFYPLITRIYTPAELGGFATFEAIFGMLVTLSTFRYHQAIPMADSDRESAGLFWVSIGAVGGVSVLTLMGSEIAGAPLLNALGLGAIGDDRWLLSVAVFFGGVIFPLHAWQLRLARFPRLAFSRIAQGAVQAGSQFGLGLLGAGTPGLIAGLIAGRIAALAAVLIPVTAARAASGVPRLLIADTARTAWHYRRLPLWSSWSAIINAGGLQLSIVILSAQFGPAEAGWYGLALLATAGPVGLLNQAIEQVFSVGIREAQRTARLPELSLSIYATLARLGIVPMALFMAIAPELFETLFGSAWRQAGYYAVWQAPWVVAAYVGSHLAGIVLVRQWQRAELAFNLLLLASRCAALFYGAAIGNIDVAIAGYGLSSAVLLLAYSSALLAALGNSPRAVLKVIGTETLLALTIIAPILLTRLPDDAAHPIAAALLSTVAAAILITRRAIRFAKAPVKDLS